MKIPFCTALLGLVLAGVGTLRADEALRRIQQSLRDQGFYYGAIDGSPGDETTQAVRRYQIRNGLSVTGQLDDETRRTIEKTGGEVSTTRPTVRPVPTPGTSSGRAAGPTPTPRRALPGTVDGSSADPNYQRPTVRPAPDSAARPQPPAPRGPPDYDEEDDADVPATGQRGRPDAEDNYGRPDLRVQPGAGGPAAGGGMPRNAVRPSARLTDLFASTPYEFAPPPVQADTLRRAQGALTRQGFYDGPVNGMPSALTEEALTNYQGVKRLRRTGRLDVSTLGSLRLLPGRQRVAAGDDDEEDDRPRHRPNIIFEGRVVR